MVEIFGDLAVQALIGRQIVGLANVVVGAEEEQVVRALQEGSDRRLLGRRRPLLGSQGIETDHHHRVRRPDRSLVQRRVTAVVADAFEDPDRPAGQGLCQGDERGKVRLLDVIEKSRHALIDRL